jgi:flagellar biogenesis protein FliO
MDKQSLGSMFTLIGMIIVIWTLARMRRRR